MSQCTDVAHGVRCQYEQGHTGSHGATSHGAPACPSEPHSPFDCPARLAEEGRRLASQREDLIAQGVDPVRLAVPLHPEPGGSTPGGAA